VAVFEHVLRLLTGDSEERVDRLGDKMDRLGKEAGRASDRLDDAGKEAERLGRRAGDTATNAGKLGGVLGRISPQLEELARFTTDAADALEVASAGGAGLLRVLGPVAVAVGLAAGAYYTLSQQLDKATASMEEARKKSDEMVAVHRKVREAALLAALASKELTQEEYNRIVSAQNAKDLFEEQNRSARERVKTAQEELDLLRQQRSAAEAALVVQRQREASGQVTTGQGGILAGTSQATSAEQAEFLRQQVANLTAAIGAQEGVVAAASTGLNTLTEAQKKYADSLETAANAPLKQAAALERQRDATKAQSEALQQLTRDLAALGAMYDALPTDPRLAALRSSVSAFAPAQQALDPRQQAGLLQADLSLSLSRGQIGGAEYERLSAAVEAGLQAGLQEAADAQREAAAAQQSAADAMRADRIRTASAALTGDPTALLSALGGGLQGVGSGLIGSGMGGAGFAAGLAGGGLSAVAGPVGLALSGLSSVGNMGADGVRQQTQAFTESIVAGLQSLPEILFEVIPEFVGSLVTELPPALVRALAEGLQRAFEAVLRVLFPNQFDGETRLSRAEQDARLSAALGGDYEAATAAAQSGGAATGRTGGASAARTSRQRAAARVMMARSSRQAGMQAGATQVNITALSVDQSFAVNAARDLDRLTDPSTGLRRRSS
jgi:hypothetical protein